MIFKKKKKNYFDIFLNEKYFEPVITIITSTILNRSF